MRRVASSPLGHKSLISAAITLSVWPASLLKGLPEKDTNLGLTSFPSRPVPSLPFPSLPPPPFHRTGWQPLPLPQNRATSTMASVNVAWKRTFFERAGHDYHVNILSLAAWHSLTISTRHNYEVHYYSESGPPPLFPPTPPPPPPHPQFRSLPIYPDVDSRVIKAFFTWMGRQCMSVTLPNTDSKVPAVSFIIKPFHALVMSYVTWRMSLT